MVLLRTPLLALAATALLLSGCASTELVPPVEYGIKDGWTGSAIRRYVVRPSGIPINRRYSELTVEQKSIVHSWYERIAPGDEPPFPAEGLKPVHDAVRRGQGKALVTGEMLLLAAVSASGEVESVKVFRSPSEQMTNFVSSVLVLTKFKPAVCGGNPCRMEYPFTFTFKVE